MVVLLVIMVVETVVALATLVITGGGNGDDVGRADGSGDCGDCQNFGDSDGKDSDYGCTDGECNNDCNIGGNI